MAFSELSGKRQLPSRKSCTVADGSGLNEALFGPGRTSHRLPCAKRGNIREPPPMNTENLLENIPAELPEELFSTILQAKGFRVERIVSQGTFLRRLLVRPAATRMGRGSGRKRRGAVRERAGTDPTQPRLMAEHSCPYQTPSRLDGPGSKNRVAGDSLWTLMPKAQGFVHSLLLISKPFDFRHGSG